MADAVHIETNVEEVIIRIILRRIIGVGSGLVDGIIIVIRENDMDGIRPASQAVLFQRKTRVDIQNGIGRVIYKVGVETGGIVGTLTRNTVALILEAILVHKGVHTFLAEGGVTKGIAVRIENEMVFFLANFISVDVHSMGRHARVIVVLETEIVLNGAIVMENVETNLIGI